MIYSHITDSIEKTVEFWNNTMNERCVDFNENHAKYDKINQQIGTRLMTEYIDASYDLRMDFFEYSKHDIEHKLFFMESSNEKIKYISEELIRLKEEYNSNTFSSEFPIYSYLSALPYEQMSFDMFERLISNFDQGGLLNAVYENMHQGEFETLINDNSSGYEILHSTVTTIYILQANLELLQKENITTHTHQNVKEYSLVFENKCSKELFIFCMNEYDKSDISKTLISKYFNLFAGKGYIIEEHALKVFYQFVKINFSLNMNRLESYTSSDLVESKRFKGLESNFIKNKKISSII